MRKMQFRAWDLKNKKMYDLDYIVFDGYEITEYSLLADNGRRMQRFVDSEEYDNAVLMQWTGLKDSKGKDIFEGDICKGAGWNDQDANQVGIVKWHGMGFIVKNISNQCRGGEVNLTEKLKVIGNIYENPELLKE